MIGILGVWIIIQVCLKVEATANCNVGIDVDIAKLEGSSTFVACEVPAACGSTKIEWHKYQPTNGEWIPVYQEESGVYQPLNTGVDYSLSDRSSGRGFGTEHFLFINQGAMSIPSDSGRWKCTVESGGTVHQSGEVELEVISEIEAKDIVIERNDTTTLKQPEKYICKSTTPLYPEFDVIWEVEGQNVTNGTKKNYHDAFLWYTENEAVLTLYSETEDKESEVTCYFVKTVGAIRSEAKTTSRRAWVLPAVGLATWLIVLIVLIVCGVVAGPIIGFVVYKKKFAGTGVKS